MLTETAPRIWPRLLRPRRPREMVCPYCGQKHTFSYTTMHQDGAVYPAWGTYCPAKDRVIYAHAEERE